MLTFAPILLDGRRLLCTITYSALTRLFVLVSYVFGHVVSTSMYISALLDALGTPSEFSSVPILVADELAHSSSCETPILGNYPTPKHLSLEQLSISCDLAIHVTTTRNIPLLKDGADHISGGVAIDRELFFESGLS
jgi:hypothetical protein